MSFDSQKQRSLSELLQGGESPWLNILSQTGDGLLVSDANGQIVYTNSVLQEQLELSAQLPESFPLAQDAEGPDSRQESILEHLVQSTLSSAKAHQQDIKVFVGLGRKKYFRIHVIPVDFGGSSPACVVVFRDITAIKTTEKMRRDFVANVSHELRTPLSVLKGYAETLLSGALEDPSFAHNFVDVIARHANRLSQLVEDLLDLSRLESSDFQLELRPLKLESLCDRVMTITRDSARTKQIHIESYVKSPLPMILGNSSALEQVLVNLMDNAIKYTPEAGEIKLRVRDLDDRLELCVPDTGMGIEAKHIPRLFERFYRVDKARSREMGGTGLGLSIVKHIVQAHEGDIWVESTPGKGSRFFFTVKKASEQDSVF